MGAKRIDREKESLLVVDDDPQVGEVLCELVKALGFPCALSTSGQDALNKLQTQVHGILLTDMRMPEMNGFELIRTARGKYPDLIIIAMTGYIEEFRHLDIIDSGADDFIRKPVDIGELEAKLIRNIGESKLKKELSRLSITDSLTGLFNRREFNIRLRNEIVRSVRQRHPLGLILVDVDNFKAYNDRYGHVAGDAVLRSVGRAINRSIREGVDTGYRYGGDEFAVILIDSDLNIAEEIGKRIQEAVAEENGAVGASVGYAMYSERMSLKEFVAAADSNLYKAKNRRRNPRNSTGVGEAFAGPDKF